MGDYCSVRVWQLKAGASAAELEDLTASGVLEMQRWIPGVKHLTLVRLSEAYGASQATGAAGGRYAVITTFSSFEAYKYWRQVEEEGPDYWERYASVLMHWERLAQLVAEYAGEMAMSAEVNPGM